MKIVTIVGARPQFIKAATVSRAIKNHNNKISNSVSQRTEVLVHTGQHYDQNMSAVFFNQLEIPEPNVNLGVGSGPHGWQTAEMLTQIEKVLVVESETKTLCIGNSAPSWKYRQPQKFEIYLYRLSTSGSKWLENSCSNAPSDTEKNGSTRNTIQRCSKYCSSVLP